MSDRPQPPADRFAEPAFVERLRRREPDALQQVVRRYLPQILRAARGAGLAPDRAEDLTQATFAAFLERVPHFEGRAHVRTFLFGIFVRKLSEARRERERDDRLDEIDETVRRRFAADGSWRRPPRPADERLFAGQLVALVERGLAELPFKQRMAFYLREVAGFTTQEICKILDVSATHVGVLLFRARNRLREHLEAHGIEPPRG